MDCWLIKTKTSNRLVTWLRIENLVVERVGYAPVGRLPGAVVHQAGAWRQDGAGRDRYGPHDIHYGLVAGLDHPVVEGTGNAAPGVLSGKNMT